SRRTSCRAPGGVAAIWDPPYATARRERPAAHVAGDVIGDRDRAPGESARHADGAPYRLLARERLHVVDRPDRRNRATSCSHLSPEIRVDEVGVNDVRSEAPDRRRDAADRARVGVGTD